MHVKILDFMVASSMCGLGAEGPGSAKPLRRERRSGTTERDKYMLKRACVKANGWSAHPEYRIRPCFRGHTHYSLSGDNDQIDNLSGVCTVLRQPE